ncbi:MAG: hypothetical protein WA891_03130 [Acidobacteriaceae bacterium]
MTIQVELNAEMETQLAGSRASQEEFRAFLDALANKAPDVPQLRSEKFSRETIYGEHD